MYQFSKKYALVFGVLISSVLVGCGSEDVNQQAAAAPAPNVGVAEVVSMRLSEWDEYSGRLSAPESVTLIPRISGYVSRVIFNEGDLVEKGDVLLEIDEEPYVVEVERLAAQMKSAKSRVQLASSEFNRGKSLIAQNAISQEALDNRHATLQQAEADADAIQASLKRAKLELSYTKVTAPVSGRVSRALITQGNYVTAGQSKLTTLVSTAEMYAYFDIDEQTYLSYVRSSLISANGGNNQTVAMALAGDSEYSFQGNINFFDNQVSENTGSIRVRASFENSDGILMPGLFARVRIAGTQMHDGILIDEKAIGTDLNNKYVLVVSESNTVEYRAITLGESLGELRIVESGLNPGDVIVVNGLQRVQPGMRVSPNDEPMADTETIAAIKLNQAMLEPAEVALSASLRDSTGQ